MTNLEMAQKAMTEACRELGLQDDVEVVEIKNGTRWILAWDQKPGMPKFEYAMIKLENVLREVTRSGVELMSESETDKNRRDKKSGRLDKMINARNVESLES